MPMSAAILRRVRRSTTAWGARIQPMRRPAHSTLLTEPMLMTASGACAAMGAGSGRSSMPIRRRARSSTTGRASRAAISATNRLRRSESTEPVGFWWAGTR